MITVSRTLAFATRFSYNRNKNDSNKSSTNSQKLVIVHWKNKSQSTDFKIYPHGSLAKNYTFTKNSV